MISARTSQSSFYSVLGLLFAASAVVTIVWCRAMSAMGGDMPMPGGWTMSMVWMLMPGQTLTGAALSFLGMWTVMMAAMMLPSLAPMLARYRETVGRAGETNLGWLTAVAGAGYFFVWAVVGIAVFLLGFALSAVEMERPTLSHAVPVITALAVVAVGALQFTAWKAHRLACCRKSPDMGQVLPATPGSAWRHGLRIGRDCGFCCFGLMLPMIVLGIMDLRLMVLVTAAITAERLAPSGVQVAKAIGALTIVAGLMLIARAVGFC